MPSSTPGVTTTGRRLLALALLTTVLLSSPVQGFCPAAATSSSSSTALFARSTSLNYRDEATEPPTPELYVPPSSRVLSTTSTTRALPQAKSKPAVNEKKQWANTEALNDVRSIREQRQRQQPSYSSLSLSSNTMIQQQQQQQNDDVLKAIQHEKQNLQRHYNQMSSVAAEHDKRPEVLKLQDHGHLHLQLARRHQPPPMSPTKKRFVRPPPPPSRDSIKSLLVLLLPNNRKESLRQSSKTTAATTTTTTTTALESQPSTLPFSTTTTTTTDRLPPSRWHRYKKLSVVVWQRTLQKIVSGPKK